MKKNIVTPPNVVKYFFILASIVLTLYVLIMTQSLVKPLLAAFIFALLLKPVSAYMEKIKIPRLFSALLTILLMLVFLLLVAFFLAVQIKYITADVDIFINSFNATLNKIQQWAADRFGIAPSQQITYIKNTSTSLFKNSVSFLQNTLMFTADFFIGFFLFLISVFFFLYYRTFLVAFLMKCFSSSTHTEVKITLRAIQVMVRKYIIGLFFVILTIAILNTLGLLLLGIKHAIFFGAMGGILTIIPYIGITVGAFLPFLFALATTNSLWYPLGVIVVFVVVQFLEGNFVTPKIIGSQISLNPFASLLILFFGGMFFGLMGIVLSLPLLAMIKIIFDHMDSLKPLGYLLGNPEVTHKSVIKKYFKKLLTKMKK